MKNNKIKFSIIIPTYNRASLIKKTIESVLNQTYSNFELIVVDDGSTDNTKEVVTSFVDTRINYFKKNNEERGAARNAGKIIAKGDYITFLDSDDLFYINHLQEAYNLIINHNSPAWFHLPYEIKSPDNRVLRHRNYFRKHPDVDLIKGNFLSCNAVFLRSDISTEYLFNEDRNLSTLEDWELWLRIIVNHKIVLSNKITSAIINHDDRSVLQTDKDKLIHRMETFMNIVLSNKKITQYYNNKLHHFKSSCYTYISLHLALTKKYKKDSLLFLFKGIKANPLFIFERRFLAIIKNLIV